MTQQVPGWYADPTGKSNGRKYWDGREWQLHLKDPSVVSDQDYAKGWANNGLSGKSAFFGVASVLTFLMCLGLLFGPVAIILGVIGLMREHSRRTRRLALIGILTGFAGFVLSMYFMGVVAE